MIPLFSNEQVRKADNYAINRLKIPGLVLMENASRSIFQITLEKLTDISPSFEIGIICGKGNNGGDGFALARHFINHGYKVKIVSLSSGRDLKGDAKTNFEILKLLIKNVSGSSLIFYKSPKDINKLKSCHVLFDAILGTGGKGELKEPYRTIVKTLNKFDGYKIAVDVPTGIDLDNGTGDLIFDADLTITLSELKTGLFYGSGYKNAGEIAKGYIGIGDEYYNEIKTKYYLIEPEDAFIGVPVKKIDDYKYSAGKVLSIAGSGKLPGAACFTANSAIYSGAGASILTFPDSVKSIAHAKLESTTIYNFDDEGNEFLLQKNIEEIKELLDWADSIAIGPGLGRENETIESVRKLLKMLTNKRVVIDADGLFAISNNYFKKVNLSGMILTPHHQEFSQLIGVKLSDLHNNIMKYGKKFAEETESYLVLKGAPTIIFTPLGEALINTTGNSGMATFGTGDVLTGMIASFIAQSNNIEEAVISAVYIHSLAADLLLNDSTEHGITAESLMKKIPSTIKFLEDSVVKSNI